MSPFKMRELADTVDHIGDVHINIKKTVVRLAKEGLAGGEIYKILHEKGHTKSKRTILRYASTARKESR